MKDALGIHRLRRIGVPGIILALGIHPFIAAWINLYVTRTYGFTTTIVFVAEIFIFGVIASGATTFVYYAYEGFRMPALTRLAKRRNRRKLRQAIEALNRLYDGKNPEDWSAQEKHEETKLSAYIADFPLLEHEGELKRRVERPTRLGNIIAAYELYGEAHHKVDVRAYWHHVLSCAPDGIRQDFEDAMSFAESLLLASAAGVFVSMIASAVVVGHALGAWSTALVVVTVRVSIAEAAVFAICGLVCWWVFYQLALAAHREVGSIFRALVDVSIEKFFAWHGTLQIPRSAARLDRAATIAEYLTYGTPVPAGSAAAGEPAIAPARPPDSAGDLEIVIVSER